MTNDISVPRLGQNNILISLGLRGSKLSAEGQ